MKLYQWREKMVTKWLQMEFAECIKQTQAHEEPVFIGDICTPGGT
jgi:hypothetical protein